jgi:hypothetical protein
MNGQATVPAIEAIAEVAVVSVPSAYSRKKLFAVWSSKTAV